MKNLHVLTPYSVKPQNIIKFICKNFSKSDNYFLILADERYVLRNNPALFAYDNVIFTPAINKSVISRFKRAIYIGKLFYKSKNIIWHSFSGLSGLQLLCVSYIFRTKFSWIEYGIDSSENNTYCSGIKNKFLNYLKENIKAECKFWGSSVYHNLKKFERKYQSSKKTFFLPQPVNFLNVDFLKKNFVKEVHSSGFKRVLIGTDGLDCNNHREIVDKMCNFKGMNFSCFVPMNFATSYEYGLDSGKKYLTEVIEYGNRILEVPFVRLGKSSVEVEKYCKFLNSMDIAIFDCNRPMFLDIILYLLFLGKKVYVPFDSALYSSFSVYGLMLFDTNKIKELSYDEFISEFDLSSNQIIIDKLLNEGYCISNWRYYFDYIEKMKDDYGKN